MGADRANDSGMADISETLFCGPSDQYGQPFVPVEIVRVAHVHDLEVGQTCRASDIEGQENRPPPESGAGFVGRTLLTKLVGGERVNVWTRIG